MVVDIDDIIVLCYFGGDECVVWVVYDGWIGGECGDYLVGMFDWGVVFYLCCCVVFEVGDVGKVVFGLFGYC